MDDQKTVKRDSKGDPAFPVACQEAVKSAFNSESPTVTPEYLKLLRRELSESLTQFGLTLKRAIHSDTTQGFTRQYVSRLEHGQDPITAEIQDAYYKIYQEHDQFQLGVAGSVWVKVLAQPTIPEGVLIPASAKAVKCARPGCPVWFVRVSARQTFHDPQCREQAAKERKRGE